MTVRAAAVLFRIQREQIVQVQPGSYRIFVVAATQPSTAIIILRIDVAQNSHGHVMRQRTARFPEPWAKIGQPYICKLEILSATSQLDSEMIALLPLIK